MTPKKFTEVDDRSEVLIFSGNRLHSDGLLIQLLCLPQTREHLAKTIQAGFEVFDDLFSQIAGFGQVVQVGQALVPEPEDVQTRLVARYDLLIPVAAPTAFRCILLVPGSPCAHDGSAGCSS